MGEYRYFARVKFSHSEKTTPETEELTTDGFLISVFVKGETSSLAISLLFSSPLLSTFYISLSNSERELY